MYLQNEEGKKYCNAEVFLNATKPDSTTRGPLGSNFYTFKVPLSQFKCDYEGAFLKDITNISFENANERRAYVCIARVTILRNNGTETVLGDDGPADGRNGTPSLINGTSTGSNTSSSSSTTNDRAAGAGSGGGDSTPASG